MAEYKDRKSDDWMVQYGDASNHVRSDWRSRTPLHSQLVSFCNYDL